MSKRKIERTDIDQELNELNTHLKELATWTRFAVDGEAYELPSVIGIDIYDFGQISLPLKDPEASELIKRCEQSSIGKGSEKCLDTNSYQLESSQFKINHPDWDKKLQQLVSRVAIELGTDAKVEAKINKLLIYKQGDHILKHKDTEIENRKFATLIIQLPSDYSGGELVVYDQNGDQQKKIDFINWKNKHKYSMHFAAHYAGLDHEMLEVQSGYRLALVYSICWATEKNQVNKSVSNVRSIDQKVVLKKLNNLFGDDTYRGSLGMLLDHIYTEQSLTDSGIGALKGIDNARYSMLSQANSFLPSENQLAFYICEAKRSINFFYRRFDRYSQSDIDFYRDLDVNSYSEWGKEDGVKRSESFEIVDWYDINGNKIECNKSYIEKALEKKTFFIDVLNPSKGLIGLDDLDTWGKETKIRMGYMGKFPTEKQCEYKKYLLVLFPRNQLQTMIAIDFGGAIDSIYRTAIEERNTTDSEMRSNIENICFGLCTQHSRAKKLTARSFSQIFQLLIIFKMQKEFESILKICPIKINQECAKRLGEAISQFGFDSLKNTLEKFLKPSVGNFTNICALVKMIYDDNQTDVSLNMFVHFLLPLITNSKNCDEIMITSPNNKFEFEESCQPDNVLIVAKFFELYMQQTSAMCQLFKDSMLKFMNEKCEWAKFIDVVGKEKQQSTFQSCQPLLEIIEKRKKCLEEKTAQESSDQSNSDELEKLNRFFSQ